MDILVKNFLQTDLFGVKPDAKPPVGKKEERAMSILRRTIRHVVDRYEVGVLWKANKIILPYNYNSALSRLVSLERRYLKDPSL